MDICLKKSKEMIPFDEIVDHVSMAHPTSNGLMNACEEAIKKEKIEYQRNGTYVVMEGPQSVSYTHL